MIDLLQSLLTLKLDLLVGGHYVNGTLTSLDLTKRLAYIDAGNEKWIVAVDQIAMVKLS